MNPYHGYPFGPVKLARELQRQVLPWRIIEVLVEHATHAGRSVTRREADDVLQMLCLNGTYTTCWPGGEGRTLVVTTTLLPRLTQVTLQPEGGRP